MMQTATSNLVRWGWLLIWLGVVSQLSVAIYAVYAISRGRCNSGLTYTFGPLLVTCGDRSPLELAAGWVGTVVVLGGPAAGFILAFAGLRNVRDSSVRFQKLGAIWLAATSALTAVIWWATSALTGSPSPWGEGAWIFFSAVASLFAVGLCSVGYVVVRWILTAAPRSGHDASHPPGN